MEKETALKPVYIVVSQTGTLLSQILKMITGKEYNHASLSFDNNLNTMYSFGRKNPYNPFWAGFVQEAASFGTFKRFSDTKIIVLELLIPENEYNNLLGFINFMVENPKNYRYNYLGLWFAAVNICHKSHNRYYCSEFVRDMLIKHNVRGAEELERIVHPMSFIALPETQIVFSGKLKDFSLKKPEKINIY